MVNGGSHSALTKVYVTVALTFVIGALALYMALKSQREVVVYRDRTADNKHGENGDAGDENKTTITLDGVKNRLQQAVNEKEILQAGIQSICKQLDAGQGALYLSTENEGVRKVELKTGYALSISENATISFDFGEGLIGQCAANGQTLYVDDVPEGYIKIISGLGSASPRFLLLVPVKTTEKVKGVMEIASFTPISEDQRRFVEEASALLAQKISSI
jgi:methyl-accepting chemotaxis protein